MDTSEVIEFCQENNRDELLGEANRFQHAFVLYSLLKFRDGGPLPIRPASSGSSTLELGLPNEDRTRKSGLLLIPLAIPPTINKRQLSSVNYARKSRSPVIRERIIDTRLFGARVHRRIRSRTGSAPTIERGTFLMKRRVLGLP